MLAKKTNAMRKKEYKRLQQSVEQGTRRIAEIDRLIEKVFEQNATGILSDERFSKMLQSYEKEQKALIQEVADSQQTLQETEQKVTDLRLLLRTLREMTDITKLTPTLVNSLIECIEVHNNDNACRAISNAEQLTLIRCLVRSFMAFHTCCISLMLNLV